MLLILIYSRSLLSGDWAHRTTRLCRDTCYSSVTGLITIFDLTRDVFPSRRFFVRRRGLLSDGSLPTDDSMI